MKVIKYFLSSMTLLALTACGGNGGGENNSVALEIKPELNALGEFITFEVPQATIALTETSENGEAYVKIMSTISVTVKEDVEADCGLDLEAEVLDKNLNKVTDFPDFDIESMRDYDNGDFDQYLKKGTVRATAEWSTTKTKWDNNAEERELWEKIQKDGAYIVLKPRWDNAKFIPYVPGTGTKKTEMDFEVDTLAPIDTIAF